MTNYSRLFADISSNNSSFDAAAYRASGHVLVSIKASESVRYVNPRHSGWCYAAGYQHVGVMHYHFARPDLGTTPEDEARHFLRAALPFAGGRDYLCLDLERGTPQGWKHDPEWSRRFDAYVLEHSRFRVVLYASRSSLQENPGRWFEQQHGRVWDADWSSGPDFAPPGCSVFARQFTDGVFGPEPHSLPGVGRCDVSRLNLSTYEHLLRHL